MVRRLVAHGLRPIARLGVLLASLPMGERLLLLGVAVLHVVGVGWGLPASDGWDVDGVAPRDFLSGVVLTFSPGDYFTYPPLHLLLLTLLTLPLTLVSLARAPSLSPPDVIHTFTQVPVMTAFAFTARIVSLLMSLGVVLVVGRIASAIFGPRARGWAMAIAGVEVAGTYYAHTTNLDVPALFWASSALLALVLALKDDAPRNLRKAAVLVACAIATKDQAYAIFAITFPCALAAWALQRYRAGTLRELLREAVYFAIISIVLTLFLDGAFVNPTGFLARLRFLAGPASKDFAAYSNDWPGRIAAFEDAVTFLPKHYPSALAPLFGMGLVFAIGRSRGRERIAALVPLLASLSFTLTFNCVALRVEERFMLPQMQLLAIYGGGAIAGLLALLPIARSRALTWLVGAGSAALVLSGLHMSAVVIANMMGDARYDAEAYMRAHVQPGDVIEVYGENVYLPRFPDGARVQRIGSSPVTSRNPMPDIEEKQDLLGAIGARSPKWVVVSTGYTWRYLGEAHGPRGGRIVAANQQTARADEDSTNHLQALFGGTAGYRTAHLSHYAGSALFPPHPLHASLACDTIIFERR